MGLLDMFDGGFQPSASAGTAGLLSPQDKLMALFAGLSQAGVGMAQPGLNRGQALAQGLGHFGQGMQQSNKGTLQQRLIEQHLADQQRKAAEDLSQKTEQDRFALGIQTGSAGGADMLRAGGPQAQPGQPPNPRLAALMRAYPEMGAKVAAASMTPMQGKDRFMNIPGLGMVDVSGAAPSLAMRAPQDDLSKLIAARDNAPAAQKPLYDAQIQQLQTKEGYRQNADGSMTPATGGPADPRTIGMNAGVKEWAGVAPDIAKANAKPFTLGPAAQRFPGSPLDMLPQIGQQGPGPRAQPPQGVLPAMGGQSALPGLPGSMPQPSAINTNPSPGTQERAEDIEFGKQNAMRFNDAQTAAGAAASTVDNVRLARAIPAGTGKFAPVRELLGGVLAEFGYKGDLTKQAADLQSLNGITSNYILGKQMEQKGVQTEGDAQRIAGTFKKITNTEEANDVILRTVEAQALRQMEQADFRQAHKDSTGSFTGGEKAWREHIRQTPIVRNKPDGGLMFYNEFADQARQLKPDITQAQILAEWRRGGK